MAIVEMKKITLMGLQEYKQDMLHELMKLGVVEVAETGEQLEEINHEQLAVSDGDGAAVSQLETRISEMRFVLDFLEKLDRTPKGLFTPKHELDAGEYAQYIEDQEACLKVCAEIREQEQEIGRLKTEETQVMNAIQSLLPWKGMDTALEDLEESGIAAGAGNIHVAAGTIPAAVELQRVTAGLEGLAVHYELISEEKDYHYMLFLYHRDEREAVEDLLKKYAFNKISFKGMTGTVPENLQHLQRKLQEIENQRKEMQEESGKFLTYKQHFEVLYDHFTMERDRRAAEMRLLRTERVFVLEGWVPAHLLETVRKRIGSVSEHFMLEDRKPGEEEEFPVLLENPAIIKPFELITELYSLPHSRGLDPNGVMAPFFFMFFGMMVSDAAYGLLLTAVTFFLVWKLKPTGTFEKILKLLMFGGISTFLWGAVFGSWFGDLSIIFKSERLAGLLKPLWFNPLDDPIRLLVFAFILGIIHLYTGMAMQAYKSIKDGKLLDALFDQGFWYVFLTGIIFLLVPGLGTAGRYMAITGAVLLVLTQGRSEKGIVKKLVSGVLSLYNATGFLSDVLSYSRLLALGLATGVIAMVINTMGTLFGFNIIGILILLIVFVIGHVFNLLINVLGAYVHASRLQYVEFFGKFYEGGGKAFSPFHIKTKYIQVKESEDRL